MNYFLYSRVNHAHTSLEAILEMAFTTTTGEDLCLDNHVIVTCSTCVFSALCVKSYR